MAPRCMHSAAVVASFTAVSIRMARSGWVSRACGTRSTPLVPGMRMSHSMRAIRWRRSCCSASSPEPAAYTSNCCCVKYCLSALRTGSSSSTTRTWRRPDVWTTHHSFAKRPARRRASVTCRHERYRDRRRDQAGPLGSGQELLDRAAAVPSVVQGVAVHVHAHELVRAGVVHPAAERLGVSEGLVPVREPVLDARLEVAGDAPHQRRAEIAAHDVAAQRQREPGFLMPPLPEVGPQVQPSIAVRELPLVNQQARLRPSRRYIILDLVERNRDVPHRRLVQLEGEKRSEEHTSELQSPVHLVCRLLLE